MLRPQGDGGRQSGADADPGPRRCERAVPAAQAAAQARYDGVRGKSASEVLLSGSDDFTMFIWTPATDKKPVERLTGVFARSGGRVLLCALYPTLTPGAFVPRSSRAPANGEPCRVFAGRPLHCQRLV